MASRILGPRKQRTRQHVISDMSAHHVEGFILEETHSFQRLTPDYGYDPVLFTYDEQGYLEPGSVDLQLKASESLRSARAAYVFDVDIDTPRSSPPRFGGVPYAEGVEQPSPGSPEAHPGYAGPPRDSDRSLL